MCTAKALETTTVCQLPFSNLEQLSTSVPGLQRQLHRVMSRELIEEQQMLLQIGKMNAEQRLATFLLNYSLRLKHRGFSAIEFNLSMSRTDIGNYLGLAVETVSRQFTQFHHEGYIDTDRKFVRITDVPALYRISGLNYCEVNITHANDAGKIS
jgi:CRP/FNR family transcriptional regulator